FLNLVLAGFVLASIAARFIFPAVSLEGRTFWLLRSSPTAMRDVLWAKFWVGTLPLLVLALVSFGTVYPQFETENAAQIPTSFGGLLFMMTSIAIIGAVIILEARPVYSYLGARVYGTQPDATAMVVGFGLALAICVASTVVPISIALRRLNTIERA